MYTRGITRRRFIPKKEASSPTVATESVLIMSFVDTKQEIDDMSMGMPNVFAQTEEPQSDEIIMIKILGVLAGILLEIDLEKCQCFTIGKGCKTNSQAHALKELCSMLMEIVS